VALEASATGGGDSTTGTGGVGGTGGAGGRGGEPDGRDGTVAGSGGGQVDATDLAAPDGSVDSSAESSDRLVPVFLGVGYGTRRVLSCDGGLTWPHDEADVPNGGDDGTLVRGLAYGDGLFVLAVGGGGVQKLFTTEDGVTLTRFDRGGNGFSDVAYGRGRFVAGGGHVSVVSFDGYSWEQPGTMGQGGILRHLAFGNHSGGRFAAVGDNGRRMNSADGVAWNAEVEEGPSLRGVAYGSGVFVAISGDGATRFSQDGGDTWSPGTLGGASQVRGILHDRTRFIVTTSSNTFTSIDGKAWAEHAATGGPDAFAVSDDGAHYAGAFGGDLMHSTDGIVFTRVKQGGQGLTRVEFGRVSPSTICPG
jgi:hypothetical protein